ncbi:MAG: YCF48-related protein, partial [Gemmataceae bacterium]
MPSLCVCLLLAATAAPRHFEDATLRAVHFADDKEGWAVGDEGVIWHSIDGGKNWERQPSGTAGSLRSVHFVDPYIGWVAGREELPGGGAAGVVLYTTDGGQQWRRILMNSLPGLHLVRFVGPKTGYLAGDGSEQFPSGVFATTNAGRDWHPVPGPRASSWRGGDFNPEGGAMGGAWNRLATVRRGQVFSVEMDSLGGRSLTGLSLAGEDGVAVGQGGLVLESRKTRGSSWHFVETKLGRDIMENFDFHAVASAGGRAWAVGKPGTAVLTGAAGKWELLPTKQSMPLHGVHFRDEKRGWAVGELGTILATADGGKTWEVKQRGGQRLAVLCVHAGPGRALPDVVAHLGASDGYLTGGLCVTGPEPASADLGRVSDAARFEEAFRQAGGACAGQLWHFPVGSHLAAADKEKLLATWDKAHDGRAARLLLGQIVQAIRAYKPEVVVCDAAAGGASALVHEAVKEACKQAGDPSAFDAQTKALGLEPWKPRKAYAVSEKGTITLDQTGVSPVLLTTPREHATGPAQLFGQGTPPASRSFALVASDMPGADAHTLLMQGIALAPGGVARRPMVAVEELSAEVKSAVQTRTRLWAMADAPESAVNRPERMLADLGRTVQAMPDDVGARVAHGLGRLYAQRGQWSLAREAFFVLAERYPTHPLAVDGYRWLLMHQASGEVRRRYELGQFVVITDERHGNPGASVKPKDGKKGPAVPAFETDALRVMAHRSGRDDAKKWLEDCLELDKRLTTFGPLYAGEARVGFCLQAARRQ